MPARRRPGALGRALTGLALTGLLAAAPAAAQHRPEPMPFPRPAPIGDTLWLAAPAAGVNVPFPEREYYPTVPQLVAGSAGFALGAFGGFVALFLLMEADVVGDSWEAVGFPLVFGTASAAAASGVVITAPHVGEGRFHLALIGAGAGIVPGALLAVPTAGLSLFVAPAALSAYMYNRSAAPRVQRPMDGDPGVTR